MKTIDVIDALKRKYYDQQQWVYFEELRVGTGYKNHSKGLNPEQRIDFWVINMYPSKDYLKIGFEVKVSRGDFLNEMKHPSKRKQAMGLSNQFYFIAPKGLLKEHEIPEDCGWMEVHENLRVVTRKLAPVMECKIPTWGFLASLARRVNKS